MTKLEERYSELKSDVRIDKSNLDDECAKHSLLFTKWSKRLSIAEANFRRAELNLTTYKAKKMVEDKKSREKITDKMSENRYRISDNYSSLSNKKNKLKQTVDFYQAAVYSMIHRRAMLDNLVKLHTSNYYND